MFSGIIEEVGKLQSYLDLRGKRYLDINCSKINNQIKIGDSIACNGACLTVIDFNKDNIKLEAMHETIDKTTIRYWQINEEINLERALSANARLDGHFVQGHVDCISRIETQEYKGDTLYLWFELPKKFQNFVTWQGSIAINGVSLTIAKLENFRFAVALISHTANETNLLRIENYANIEFDIIGKYVIRYLNNQNNKKISQEWLREKGF
jgi:riboflavin synthase